MEDRDVLEDNGPIPTQPARKRGAMTCKEAVDARLATRWSTIGPHRVTHNNKQAVSSPKNRNDRTARHEDESVIVAIASPNAEMTHYRGEVLPERSVYAVSLQDMLKRVLWFAVPFRCDVSVSTEVVSAG